MEELLPKASPALAEFRERADRAIRGVLVAFGEAYGFGRVATIARALWAEHEPEFEKLHRNMDLTGQAGKKTVGGTLTTDTEGGLNCE